jgi:hypothetical protein
VEELRTQTGNQSAVRHAGIPSIIVTKILIRFLSAAKLK